MFYRQFGLFDGINLKEFNSFFLYIISYLLQQSDINIVQICLDAIGNILRQTLKKNLESIKNEIEECGGTNNELKE